jgi:SAM-dependent methyltransferase
MEISWALLRQGDVLFMQRPSTDTETRVAEIAKNCNIPVWIDYDDDYFNIPDTNPRHDLYSALHRQEQIKRVIEYADLVTVSTPAIKESIIEATGKNHNQIAIIPNAIDETLFDIPLLTDINELKARDIIMWRGGDTHSADIEPYIDKIVLLYNEYPQYKWAFIGAAPENLLKMVDTSRILLYAWEDVFVYFDRLFDLKPRLAVVPWARTKFNDSKSNCSWLESTLAGAPTVFPHWSSESTEGMIKYTADPESFYSSVKMGIENPDEIVFTAGIERYTLQKVNYARKAWLDMFGRNRKDKLGFRNPKYLEALAPVDDKGFYNYCHEKLHIQDNPVYKESHYRGAQTLIDKYNPKSVVEIGCGPGPMLEYFLDKKIPQAVGFEINPHFKDYFVKRNPHYASNFNVVDINEVELEGVFDLGISIEVFEHIPADKVDALIARLAKHFKYFYFSSTPYHTSKQFDAFWFHINLRTHEHWIKTFEERGWIYEGNPHLITPWDLVFKSALVNDDIKVVELGTEEKITLP